MHKQRLRQTGALRVREQGAELVADPLRVGGVAADAARRTDRAVGDGAEIRRVEETSLVELLHEIRHSLEGGVFAEPRGRLGLQLAQRTLAVERLD